MSSRLLALAVTTLLAAAAPRIASAGDKSTGNVIFAIEVGTGAVSGASSSVYGRGIGKSLVLGYRFRSFTLEWHFSQQYQLSVADVIDGEDTAGALGLSTLGVRHNMQGRHFVLSGFAGLTRAEMPMLVVEANVNVERQHVAGWGAIAGGGIGVPLAKGQVLISVEARAAWVSWGALDWDDPYVSEIEVTGENTATITQSTEAIEGLPWTLGLRMQLLF